MIKVHFVQPPYQGYFRRKKFGDKTRCFNFITAYNSPPADLIARAKGLYVHIFYPELVELFHKRTG